MVTKQVRDRKRTKVEFVIEQVGTVGNLVSTDFWVTTWYTPRDSCKKSKGAGVLMYQYHSE